MASANDDPTQDPTMHSPAPPPSDAIRALRTKAAETAYCRPALRELGAALPADDSFHIAALHEAADRRDAKAFTHLYLAALFAGRRIPADVLEMGGALLPEAMMIAQTAACLEGDVAASLAVAVRSGRMGSEREATAIVVGWLDYERREISAPAEFITLTRTICRQSVRTGLSLVRSFLCIAAKLSGDPVAASILNADIERDRGLDMILKELRKTAAGSAWVHSIPANPQAETLIGGGGTVKRALPKARRNDPCPCGSGRKFKQCCEGKITANDQYAVGGVTISEAAARPELVLTPQRIHEMRSYELYALDPKRLIPPLAGEVAVRLARFREFARAIEVIEAAGPKSLSVNALDEIAFEFLQAKDAEALRWLVDWEPEAIHLSFDMEVLLASPPERLRLLQEKARVAVEAERAGDSSAQSLYADVGLAALMADPALGLLIARGVLPVSSWINQSELMEHMEDARDLLGLDQHEPGYEILDATEQTSIEEERHAIDLEKIREETATRVNRREQEIQKLKSQIDTLQKTLTQREEAIQKVLETPREKPAPADPRESSEARELRDQLRRLKDNLKVEHDDRNRAMRELRAAQEQLRRATRAKPGATETNPPAEPQATDAFPHSIDIEWQAQALRIPEYSPAFREALGKCPRQASAAALAAAGRLAAGDPSIWKTVRALKLRPGTLRVRIAGDYRLLFETGPADTLRLVDLILRRDLERWLAGGGR